MGNRIVKGVKAMGKFFVEVTNGGFSWFLKARANGRGGFTTAWTSFDEDSTVFANMTDAANALSYAKHHTKPKVFKTALIKESE